MDTNKVEFTGKIVKIAQFGSVIVTTIRITTEVASGTDKPKVISDYPKVVWYSDRSDAISKFNLYDRVRITGIVKTKRKNIDGENVYFQNIVGETISSWAQMDDKMTNSCCLSGVVKNVYTPNDRFSSIRLEIELGTDQNGFRQIFYPNICAFGNVAECMRNQINVGDRIEIEGSIETRKTQSEDGNKYTEIIVCKTVNVID